MYGRNLGRCLRFADTPVVLYSYSNGSASIEIETLFDTSTNEFVLKFRRGHQPHHVERFKDEIAYRTRLEAIDRELEAQQWLRVGPPVVLADGWKI